MITKITIKDFKKLENISFELGNPVVLVGPNNSGKTSILQALSLWEIGLRKLIVGYQKNPAEFNGEAYINRLELHTSLLTDVKALWRNKNVTSNDLIQTPVSIEIETEILVAGIPRKLNLSFGYSNVESITCTLEGNNEDFIAVATTNSISRIAFLQPMSGLAFQEEKLSMPTIERKIGEGRTAEVLRNICHNLVYPETFLQEKNRIQENWPFLISTLNKLFSITIKEPENLSNGLMTLFYEKDGRVYEVASAGRGFLQTLLLLAYLYSNPDSILLLDEPDAHLEVIRQREIFQVLIDVAKQMNSQLIVTTHSEVIMNNAGESASLIGIIDNQIIELNDKNVIKRFSQSLREIGWDKYYLARLKGHVLFLEGETDLSTLTAFARKLNHPVEKLLLEANVDFAAHNEPSQADYKFSCLKQIYPQLKGFALYDKIDKQRNDYAVEVFSWEKREIENYFASPELLVKYAQENGEIMREVVKKNTLQSVFEDRNDPWWNTHKLSDDWLERIFSEYHKALGLPQAMSKKDYHHLIDFLEPEEIHPEVIEKLDIIYNFLNNG